ncbi:MAG: DUF262 domain-containing protein, partial [Gammaproteobacteria bacterium]
GFFGPETAQGRRQVFRLTGLDEKSPYAKKRYIDLSESDQRKLRNTVMRVVNIKQLAPSDDDTSMFYVFERLNTGGTPLKPQEIRNCVFAGDIVNELRKLNDMPEWRTIIGRPRPEKHQRDVEIILRVFAFFALSDAYEKPMKAFLNNAMAQNRSGQTKDFLKFKSAFMNVTKALLEQVGERPFNVRGPINLAALDSVYATLLPKADDLPENLAEKLAQLYLDEGYQQSIFFNTSDNITVQARMKIAKSILK